MTRTQERHAQVTDALLRLDLDAVAYVPSNSIAPVIRGLEEADRERVAADGGRRRVFPVSREEEAVGLVGALPLAGRFGAIVMQDNGFGNALTALTTFTVAYHLPLLIVANTRGGLGEYNSMIHAISAPVPDLLKASGIATFRLDRRHTPEDWGATVEAAGTHARMTYRPVVVLMEFYDIPGEGSVA
ncbi:MAG TPA: hypothetical protein VFL94_07800 [Actinomycetales bacterium]|nr:hypothetical protein [Actinomycetales bacterium]